MKGRGRFIVQVPYCTLVTKKLVTLLSKYICGPYRVEVIRRGCLFDSLIRQVRVDKHRGRWAVA